MENDSKTTDVAKDKANEPKPPRAQNRSSVEKIFIRKCVDRIQRNAEVANLALQAGYTSQSLSDWVADALIDYANLPGKGADNSNCPMCLWPCNILIPAHEQGEVWQAVFRAPDQKLYMIGFKLLPAGIELVGDCIRVEEVEQYKIVDDMIESSVDEEAGRQPETEPTARSARNIKPGRMYRYFDVDMMDTGTDTFEIPVSFASELPGVQRCGGSDGRNAPSEFERAAGLKSGQLYVEILDHDPANVDHSILNNDGAVLDEHDEKDQIGVIKRGTAHTKSTRISHAVIRMGSDAKGQLRHRQMTTGIRPHLSAGYKHTGYLGKENLPNGQVAHRFSWMGSEISSVAVPMDGTIGVGRSYKELPPVDSELIPESSRSKEQKKDTPMTDEEKKAQEAIQQKAVEDAKKKAADDKEKEMRADMDKEKEACRTAFISDEKKRSEAIFTVRDAWIKERADQEKQIRELADTCFKSGDTADAFKLRVLEHVAKAAPAKTTTLESLKYSEKERKEFSIRKGLANMVRMADEGKQGVTEPDGDTLEGDVSRKMRKLLRSSFKHDGTFGNGWLVPYAPSDDHPQAGVNLRNLGRSQQNRMTRDQTMQATIFGQGGATVQTELLLPIIELLRNEMVTSRLDITTMAGLEGNIVIPRQTAAATAYALAETAAINLSGQLLDQIPLVPHKVGAYSQYSKQLLLQSSMDVENFIRTDLFAVLGLQWDEYIINGQGAGGQPTGILSQAGVTLVNGTGQFSGYSGDANAPQWSDIVNFETQIAKLNARRQGRAFATTSNAKGKLKTLAKLMTGATTVPAVALWEDGGMEGEGLMNGYRAIDSQQIPNDLLIFGVWAQNVIHALWGGLDIVVDPYSLSTQGLVKIVMNTWGDVAIRHPQEFCISLNSAAA